MDLKVTFSDGGINYADGKSMVADLVKKLTLLGSDLSGPVAKAIVSRAVSAVHQGAIDRCPYDATMDGQEHLEKAIKFDVKSGFLSGGGGKQGYYGRVFIEKSGDTGKYAMRMHEDDYQPGPDSVVKGQLRGVRVGRKFIERAYRDNENDVFKMIQNETIRALRQLGGANDGASKSISTASTPLSRSLPVYQLSATEQAALDKWKAENNK